MKTKPVGKAKEILGRPIRATRVILNEPAQTPTTPEPAPEPEKPLKHAHYFRNVSHLQKLDVYRIADLFGITDHALGHALKKILAAGGRGAGKSAEQDVQEAIDSLQRWQDMQAENAAVANAS